MRVLYPGRIGIGFCGGSRIGEPGEKPSEQGENQQQTQHPHSTRPESNPGHIGGRRALAVCPNVSPRCMTSKYYHVKFVHFMLLAVSEETKTWLPFFRSLYNKTIIKFGFAIPRIFGVSVKIFSLSLRLRLITPTSTLIILDITKTSSNNYLLFIPRQ